jgi:hypothetical protein
MTGARPIGFVAAIAIAAVTLFPGVGSAAGQDGAKVAQALSQDQKANAGADVSERARDTARPQNPDASAMRDRRS